MRKVNPDNRISPGEANRYAFAPLRLYALLPLRLSTPSQNPSDKNQALSAVAD